MARTAAQDKTDDAKAKQKDKAAKAKEKERAAKAKEKEKAAKQKEKDKAAKAKEKERAAKAKEKERAARQKEKDKAAKQKEKERAAKQKDKAAKQQKGKGREDRAGAQGRAADEARADEVRAGDASATGEGEASTADEQVASGSDTDTDTGSDTDTGGRAAANDSDAVQAAEEVAVPERGETTEVPAEVRERDGAPSVGPVPEHDTTVRPKGYIAEALGKEDAVGRSTQRATLAASYTTRDHDVIRAWAESRGGRPADVAGTGDQGAGVLRIEFPDGPGDDSRLEDVDWSSFFATFDDSDVDFLYQERVRSGDISRFHKFVRADGDGSDGDGSDG